MNASADPVLTGSPFFDSLLGDGTGVHNLVRSRVWSANVSRGQRNRVMRAFIEFLWRYAGKNDAALADAHAILSELVANIEQHAPGPSSFHVDWTGHNPRLLVLDRGPGFPPVPIRPAQDVFSESGRGLFIVNSLSLDMKIGNRFDGGGYVCVLLPVERKTMAIAPCIYEDSIEFR